MYYEEESGALGFLAGALLGAVIGASIALLAAPKTGKRMRRDLRRQVTGARERAGGQLEDLTDEVRSAMEAGRRRIRL
jgi:gas vesicle protein